MADSDCNSNSGSRRFGYFDCAFSELCDSDSGFNKRPEFPVLGSNLILLFSKLISLEKLFSFMVMIYFIFWFLNNYKKAEAEFNQTGKMASLLHFLTEQKKKTYWVGEILLPLSLVAHNFQFSTLQGPDGAGRQQWPLALIASKFSGSHAESQPRGIYGITRGGRSNSTEQNCPLFGPTLGKWPWSLNGIHQAAIFCRNI